MGNYTDTDTVHDMSKTNATSTCFYPHPCQSRKCWNTQIDQINTIHPNVQPPSLMRSTRHQKLGCVPGALMPFFSRSFAIRRWSFWPRQLVSQLVLTSGWSRWNLNSVNCNVPKYTFFRIMYIMSFSHPPTTISVYQQFDWKLTDPKCSGLLHESLKETSVTYD